MGDSLTSSRLAEFLEMLRDGKWHMLDEIQLKMELKENQIKQIVSFLKEYNLILIQETKKAIKLDENARRFFS